MRRDIDEALQGWPHDPGRGEVVARQLKARDGRTILQVRVELGLLQMEVDGRPDGVRPHGFATYLDYLGNRAAARKSAAWTLNDDQCEEADRELEQFDRRREAWLALERYERALADADHSLALMDFVRSHAPSPDVIEAREQERGIILLHRTQAAAALALERLKPDEAVDAIREGMDRLAEHRRRATALDDEEDAADLAVIEQLRALEEDIRRNFAVEKTLREQLDEAIADEDYERAARLRDQIKARR